MNKHNVSWSSDDILRYLLNIPLFWKNLYIHISALLSPQAGINPSKTHYTWLPMISYWITQNIQILGAPRYSDLNNTFINKYIDKSDVGAILLDRLILVNADAN